MEKGLTKKLDILVQENTKLQQDEISKVLEATEEAESYLREMLFMLNMDQKNKPSFYAVK